MLQMMAKDLVPGIVTDQAEKPGKFRCTQNLFLVLVQRFLNLFVGVNPLSVSPSYSDA